MHADKIVVLHEGEVVEEGSHEDLIARRGRYFNLWQRQVPDLARLLPEPSLDRAEESVISLEQGSKVLQARRSHGHAAG
jgi:ABC-type glutathione transport system ATPase component